VSGSKPVNPAVGWKDSQSGEFTIISETIRSAPLDGAESRVSANHHNCPSPRNFHPQAGPATGRLRPSPLPDSFFNPKSGSDGARTHESTLHHLHDDYVGSFTINQITIEQVRRHVYGFAKMPRQQVAKSSTERITEHHQSGQALTATTNRNRARAPIGNTCYEWARPYIVTVLGLARVSAEHASKISSRKDLTTGASDSGNG